ncbi:hypothetical protein Agabi119p4_7746 [Agaricus bisporus var. burnettii]|uniref:Uncharacterized protein n=1 Tax=Agaricus bisporus var. burnettii TaxID=192524 RepID=A0A8H7C8C1_AGABI|nr:hypothetical protein Agabi119p4_7746 [Agaricus bisporus var. burnettii]
MSAGVLGQKHPVSKAFMTTDTFLNLRSRVFSIKGVEYRLAGSLSDLCFESQSYVQGAPNYKDAHAIASTLALVKTALADVDPVPCHVAAFPLLPTLLYTLFPPQEPRPITALSTCLPSEYIDALVDYAVEAANSLPLSDEDVLRHCDAFLSPEVGLEVYNDAWPVGPTACSREADRCDELEEGEVVEVRVQSNRSRKRPSALSGENTQPLSFKVLRTEGPASESPATSRDKEIRKNEGRRRRESGYLVENGRCALPRMRNKISTAVALESFHTSMLGRLVEGTQLGGYRPRVAKMEGFMEKLTERMRSTCLKRVVCPAEGVMGDLKQMGYRVVSWDGVNPTLLVDEDERVFGTLVG